MLVFMKGLGDERVYKVQKKKLKVRLMHHRAG